MESNLVSHAKRELELAGMFDKDADYNGALAPEILKLVELFSSQEHSGASAGITIAVLEKLLRFKVLSPITDNPDDWMEVDADTWQSKRQSSLFSKDGGKTYYDIDGDRDKIIESKKA